MTSSQKKDPETDLLPKDIGAEQALGLVSLGLMQKLNNKGIEEFKWLSEENEAKANLQELRHRLELTSLAIETGAPLSTAEVSILIGVKPNSSKVERGGLVARRLGRNVWRLNRAEKDSSYWRN